MNKLLFGKILLALVFVLPAPAMAQVRVDVNISLPPPIMFSAPPALVVLPETYVYVVPDADVDIFFFGGWWWRPWEGRWYRSRSYQSGWGYYRNVPSFYGHIPNDWRNDYREHRWKGRQWDHRPIPHKQVQQNWRGWEKNKHWEKQNTWGVRDLKPQTRSQHPSGAVQPRQSRPQPQEKTQVREPGKHRQPGPQAPDIRQQQPQPHSQGKPEVREPARPQQPRPQSPEVKQQRPQPQQREAQQQPRPQQERPEREHKEKQDRK